MIKLLSIFGAVGLTATAPSGIVACSTKQQQSPVASTVDENGILTSNFKMKLKKDSISFSPLNELGIPDDSMITISGLVLMNTDIDSEIKPNNKISKINPAVFYVKYKDIKNNLNDTRNKLTKDLNIRVYVVSNVKDLEQYEPQTIVMSVANTYDNKISGRTLSMVVNLPRIMTPEVPDIIPEPEVPVPDYPIPEPIKPMPLPQPVPDKPDHYNPGIIPYSNADLGLVSASMNQSGTLITAKLTGLPRTKITKEQVLVTDQFGDRVDVFNVMSELNDREVIIVMDKPIQKDQKLTIAILGIGQFDGLTNCLPVDMSCNKYTPSGWLQWESIWSLTKQACYYSIKAGIITFKLSVQLAWLLCPCQWPAVITMTACDVLWAVR